MKWLISILSVCFLRYASSLDCGMSNWGTSDRIVGGVEVTKYKYPWFASLHTVGNIRENICAGTLITIRHVVSAAHCFNKKGDIPLKDFYDVTLGLVNQCSPTEISRTFRMAQVVVHEKYIDTITFDDISLITLDVDNTQFMPICLPPKGVPISHERAVVMGFGLTKFQNGKRPCLMSQAAVDIFTKEECSKSWIPKDERQDLSNTDKAFCAGVMAGGIDACQGDSGAGLLVHTRGRYVLRGIVSFGYGCADKEEPGVYTNVAYYLDWINHTVVNDIPIPRPIQRQRPFSIRNILENLFA